MFAKHLPPSAAVPQVLHVGGAAPLDLPPEVVPTVASPGATAGLFDAVVGDAPDSVLPTLSAALRPGGRLILAQPLAPEAATQSAALLAALTDTGFIHCLVEPQPNGWVLYRGERPPNGDPLTRTQTLAQTGSARPTPYVFLLITQTPNKPPWRLTPADHLEWLAATVTDEGERFLLGFSSLTQAVAFMQAAILAQALVGINQVGKFPAPLADSWPLPVWLNPSFTRLAKATFGPSLAVDPQTAIRGDE